ncbi:MAG: hypothetical protein GY791_10405 [Alphaproteobacteria bacterium]|nr:hypothetical protein [Alphaproteobacteria bacterium]
MRLSDVLLAKGIVTTEEVASAIARQRSHGGPLTDNLLALGLISIVDLDAILKQVPIAPSTIADTGLKTEYLITLLAKSIRVLNLTAIGEIRDAMKLPTSVLENVLQEGVTRGLWEVSGHEGGDGSSGARYRLTQSGRKFADEVFDQNQYVGPAPVSLGAYHAQVRKQAIGGERVAPERVAKVFSDLVVSEKCLRRLGPALNSGKSLLLYGPPGNGKTTIAQQIGKVFEDIIFIPYCIEVGGEIIRVLDPSLHEIVATDDASAHATLVRREGIDARWIACHRPFIVTGGELSLEMLDLSFNSISKFYEMPVHLKAQGGTFVVDDFGRQLVKPEELLNRWIVPLEQGVDYLKLHTGKTLQVPFDQLTIFSTNLTPENLMDAAFLRRIPYKMLIGEPSVDEFKEIFRRVCQGRDIAWSDEDADRIIAHMNAIPGHQLARYQAKFLTDQIATAARFAGAPIEFHPDMIDDAISNLYAQDSEGS